MYENEPLNKDSEGIFNHHLDLIAVMTKDIIGESLCVNSNVKIDEYLINDAMRLATNKWQLLCDNKFIDNIGAEDAEDCEGCEQCQEGVNVKAVYTEEQKEEAVKELQGLSRKILDRISMNRGFKYNLAIVNGSNTSCKLIAFSEEPFNTNKDNLPLFGSQLVPEILSFLGVPPVKKDTPESNIIDIGHINYAFLSEREFELDMKLDRTFALESIHWLLAKEGLLRLVYITYN